MFELIYKYQLHLALEKEHLVITGVIIAAFSALSYLIGIYKIFHKPLDFIFGLICLMITPLILTIYGYHFGYLYNYLIIFIIGNLVVIRMAYIGFRNKQQGANFIIAGSIAYILFISLSLLIFNDLFPSGLPVIFRHLSVNLGFISLPISIMIYLALETGINAKDLKIKMQEVSDMAGEKQHILTNQNETLEKQVTERTAELNKSITDLKSTQNQLIQKEKLASLSELTAGIAHEIQNPLNFVSNFSEVSQELVEDVLEERKKENGKRDEELIDELLSDLSQNQQKINHHGKRAASIVSGMLEHSRISTGERVPTDINKLDDEYLRLSYHGIRAKNNTFQSDYELIADPNLPLINVVPQEIGRVLLNLINNAFQSQSRGGVDYRKKVIVRTFTFEPNENAPSGTAGGAPLRRCAG